MNKPLNLLLAAGFLALASCSTMKLTAAPAPNPAGIASLTPHSFSQNISLNYLVYLPKNYDAQNGKRWPLIYFLHGAGERGTDIWRAAIHGPTKFIKTHPDFSFILVSPQCPNGEKWSDDILMGLLDSITAKYSVDTNRIYLTGLSMGGYGAWSLATTFPERFAAVAPICGGEGNIGVVLSAMDPAKAPALKKLPIWAFHGGKDHVVATEESRHMIEIMKQRGDENVKLTIYPEADHNSWTETYDNPELYDWFLQHTLK
jgi:predicted peptidase